MTPDAELSLSLDIDVPIVVVRATVAEQLSEVTHARLEIATNEYLDLDGVLEAPARIDLAPLGFSPRRWTLRVGHVDFLRISEGSLRYVVNLYSDVWLLRFTQNTRKFRNLSAEQIVSQVLGEHGVAHRFQLVRPTETRKYCAQYRESNLDFVHRLLEHEGIYYFFEPDGTMVMADRSLSCPDVEGKAFFDLLEAAGALSWDEVGIFQLSRGRRAASGASTVNDFNWKKPKLPLIATATDSEDPELEIYDYPVGYRRPDQGTRLAQQRLEAQRVQARYLRGQGNVTAFEPARCFTMGALASQRFAGEYLLRRVEHRYFNRKFTESALDRPIGEGFERDERAVDTVALEKGVNYRNHFEAIPKSVPFRPPLVTPHPHIAGCHTAMVRGPEGEQIHTDVHGRFRAQFHWDREAVGTDEDSRWVRNTQETATGMVLARVGWEQTVAYIDGDPDRPIGIARDINGAMPSEYGQPANKTRMTIKTPNYPSNGGFNEIRLEDLAGMQHFDWFGQNDFLGEVVHDRFVTIGANETHKVSEALTHIVVQNQQCSIGGKYDVSIGAEQTFTVHDDRTKQVSGKEHRKINDMHTTFIDGDDTETVTGDRIVKAAEEVGSITRIAENALSRTVGGNWSAEGDGDIDIRVQGKLTETVGGSKAVSVEKGNIRTVVTGGKCDVTVGASATRNAATELGASGKNSMITVGGSVSLTSGKKLAINGDKILLQATTKLAFRSQALSITLEPGKTSITGLMKIDSGGDIQVTGNPDNITG